MRLYSSAESYENGDTTLMAVFETLVAVPAILLTATLFGGYLGLAFWSVCGWTLLLRTPISRFLGAKHFALFYFWIAETLVTSIPEESTPQKRLLRYYWDDVFAGLKIVLFSVAVIVGSLVIKTYATLWSLVRHPIEAIFQIPENWRRALFSLDVFVLPEMVPGFAGFIQRINLSEDNEVVPESPDDPPNQLMGPLLFMNYHEFLEHGRLVFFTGSWQIAIASAALVAVGIGIVCVSGFTWYTVPIFALLVVVGPSVVYHLIGSLTTTPLAIIFFVPAFVYRLGVKATSLAYMPLLLTVQAATWEAQLKDQLEEFRDGRWSTWRRWFAVAFIVFFVVRAFVYSALIEVVDTFNHTIDGRVIKLVIGPNKPPVWQWASLIASILVLAMYFASDKILFRLKRNDYVAEKLVLVLLRIVVVVSSLAGLFSTAANVWIIAHHEPFLRIPGMGPLWPETSGR